MKWLRFLRQVFKRRQVALFASTGGSGTGKMGVWRAGVCMES